MKRRSKHEYKMGGCTHCCRTKAAAAVTRTRTKDLPVPWRGKGVKERDELAGNALHCQCRNFACARFLQARLSPE